jgi:hypothetical protein
MKMEVVSYSSSVLRPFSGSRHGEAHTPDVDGSPLILPSAQARRSHRLAGNARKPEQREYIREREKRLIRQGPAQRLKVLL